MDLVEGQYIQDEWVCWPCIASEQEAHMAWEAERIVQLYADAGLTLELVEEYMSQMDLDDGDFNDNPFMWGGGNLGPEDTDKKTYDEWLNHFGVDDDEED
jgi:hypothetical protein